MTTQAQGSDKANNDLSSLFDLIATVNSDF
jgi:hypothetical protein